jgi:hypothetical protein
MQHPLMRGCRRTRSDAKRTAWCITETNRTHLALFGTRIRALDHHPALRSTHSTMGQTDTHKGHHPAAMHGILISSGGVNAAWPVGDAAEAQGLGFVAEAFRV